jgi:hypothetical protein
MPSNLHEALIALFHNRPGLAAELVAGLGIEVPEHDSVTLGDVSFNDATPTEYRADAVVILGAPQPRLAIVIEVQLDVAPRKEYSWPVYAATLRARMRCPAVVLVIAPEPRVAAWASRPVGLGAGSMFAACVIGPDAVPRIDTVTTARRSPELAVLSVLAHGLEPAAEALGAAALQAVEGLDEDRAALYLDLILSGLAPAARASLEELMKIKYEFQSDFAKKYYSMGRVEAVREFFRYHLLDLGVELDAAAWARLDSASPETLRAIAAIALPAGDSSAIAEAIQRQLDETD